MVELNREKKVLKVCIPASGPEDAQRYHRSILKILQKIEVDDCEPGIREDLNNIYELLSHLLTSSELLSVDNRDNSVSVSHLSVKYK